MFSPSALVLAFLVLGIFVAAAPLEESKVLPSIVEPIEPCLPIGGPEHVAAPLVERQLLARYTCSRPPAIREEKHDSVGDSRGEALGIDFVIDRRRLVLGPGLVAITSTLEFDNPEVADSDKRTIYNVEDLD